MIEADWEGAALVVLQRVLLLILMKEGVCGAVTNGITQNILQTASVGFITVSGCREVISLKAH